MWPGKSPDLNVIEHLWAILKDLVFIPPRPHDRESLIKRVENVWYSINKEYLKNLVESFPKRIEEVINNEGGHTRY